ncbi:MAG: ribonuclease Z [Bacteroides sp.]|nr:MAG: ribonuclease Z [Bacteroides sp.]
MIKFQLIILGNNAATPLLNRNTSSQILNINDNLFLIDCGEGTQVQLMKYSIKINKIKCIFISHLHGDHYFGLMGLLCGFNLNNRVNPLIIYGPDELDTIISFNFKCSGTKLKYQLIFYKLNNFNNILFRNDDVTISKIALKHNIPCNGFLFKENILYKNIRKDKIKQYNMTINEIKEVKKGNCLIKNNNLISNEELTFSNHTNRSYAYCTDTLPDESIIDKIYGINTLYHETTFMHNMKNRAFKTYHTTTIQAGLIAKKSNVGKLIIGHFSSRYHNLNYLLKECQEIFKNTYLGIEGHIFTI